MGQGAERGTRAAWVTNDSKCIGYTCYIEMFPSVTIKRCPADTTICNITLSQNLWSIRNIIRTVQPPKQILSPLSQTWGCYEPAATKIMITLRISQSPSFQFRGGGVEEERKEAWKSHVNNQIWIIVEMLRLMIEFRNSIKKSKDTSFVESLWMYSLALVLTAWKIAQHLG